MDFLSLFQVWRLSFVQNRFSKLVLSTLEVGKYAKCPTSSFDRLVQNYDLPVLLLVMLEIAPNTKRAIPVR